MHNSQNSQHSSTILGYVPALVVQHLLHLKQNKISRCLPEKQTVKSVVMFADISGFTALTEALSKIGQEGAEVIAFAINRYMELLVQGIGRSGGDIFKFAGDAMIVIWPPPQDNFEEKLELLCKQSIQSALDLQNKLNNTDIFENIKLSVKIGFGVGEMNIIHVGGIFARTEYLATGDPLIQAFSAEHCCTSGGQTMISQAVYDIIGDVFECQKVKDHHGFYQVHYLKENQVKVRMKADALLIKNNITASKFAMIKNEIQSYIPAALIPYIELNEEQWSAEIRRLTIMFVNLSIDLSDAKTEEGLQQIQRVIQTVQKCIYMHEGSLNKLLMDDKGSTLIVVFGLPPLSHQNDPIRAILTAQLMLDELPRIQCQCSVGIATGVVFAGVVGTSGSRREYSVLGDSVNLAARLMQTACGEKQNKILCCQETAKSALNNISMKFLRSVLMKGKVIETHIYIPTIEMKNQMNLFPQFRTHNFTQKQQEFNTLQIFGRDNQQKKINNALDKVIKGIDKKKIVLVKGTYGVGKSILIKKVIHRLQEKINSNQYSAWKYGELPQIFTSQLGPITKQYRLNGLREILKQIFLAFSERVERLPDLELFSMMIQEDQYPDHAISQLKQILDLEDMRNIEKFPQGKLDENLFELRRIVLQFMSSFFEQIPEKFKDLYRSPSDLGWETKSDRKPNMKYSMKNCHIICPVILVLDDMQCYDEISYKIINQMIKTYDRLAIIAIIRDSFPELGLPSKQMEKKASQDDVLLQGLSMLEDVLDPCDSVTINLRGLEKKGKEDDFSKMVKFSFNISRLIHYQSSEALRKREMTFIGDVQVQENLMNHFFLYHQNKAKLAEQDPELLFFQYVYLKTAGNPLMTLNFIQNLIDQKLLILGQKAIITEELLELISSEESIVVNAPSDRVEVNGPIIDRLSCLEQLILKCASTIGDIFDIQSLHKINPFKVAVNQRLQKMMEELETKEIIEVMETQEFNVYYRFVHPFFRECLYQRIIYKQRRQLHLAVAEAIQMLPSVIENDEIQESRRLQFHWNMSEQKWKLDDNQEPEMQKSTTNLLRQLTQKMHNTTTNSQKFTQAQPPTNENMSSKAMRSIILNQIQNKLAKNKNHSNTILQDGILEKKSNSNVTWAQRYCVLDGKEFRFYYTSNHAARGEQPLSSIPLKSLYNVIALFGRDKSGRDNVLQICSTSWFKKNKEMNDRKFLFNARNDAELEKWVIYLEFSKAKAVYEDFTNQYGKITFPIGNALDAYDQQFRQDINEKQKMGAAANATPKGRNSILSRNSRVSKFTLATKQFKFNMTQSSVDEVQQNSQYMDAVATKERMSAFVQKGLLLLFSHLFDMSIQKQDEYKPFGQSNLVMKKMTHIFKIDKSLLTDQRKSSAIGSDKQLLSPMHSEQQHRKPLNLESFGIAVKRLSHDSDSASESVSSKQHLALIKEADEEEPLEEIVEENQSIQLSESTLLKQKFLKQQRLQNQKFSFGDDSFTKNDIRISPIQSVNQGKSGSRGSQESFQEELKQSLNKPNRRNTDQAMLHEMQQTNYFNQSNMMTQKQDMVLEEFPKISMQNEQSDTPVLKQAPEYREPIQVNLIKYPEEGIKPSRRMSKSPLAQSKESLTIRPISSKNLNQLPIVEEIPKKTETRRPSKSPSNQRQSKDLTQQKIPSQKALNKSVSKSSVKSDMSVDEPTTHQELNQNIIQLLERLSKVESPTQQILTPVQQLELQKRDTITQYGTRYSNISQQPTRYKYNYMPNHSSQSQKTLQVQYSSAQLGQPLSIYGTALNTCKSLSGDVFKLNPGTRIVVMKVDHEKRLVQVSHQNQIGLFHLKDIAVLEGINQYDQNNFQKLHLRSLVIQAQFNKNINRCYKSDSIQVNHLTIGRVLHQGARLQRRLFQKISIYDYNCYELNNSNKMYVSAGKKDSVRQSISNPRYLLKVPIPQLPAYASPSSGQKENASQVTFDNKKWNPDSQDSGQKDESLSANEKSYTEAAQKILRIKTMELENKVQLLIIENERLTTFLNDQFQETEKLNNDMQALQQAGDERQRYFEEKVNIMIIENEKLQSVNRSLEAKVDSLMLQKRQLQTQKEEESKLLRDEMSLNIQKSATELQFQSQTVQLQKNMEQLLSQNSELEKVLQDQQLCIEELAQNNKKKDEQLLDHSHLKGDLQSKVKLIETLNSTMHNQETKILNLEQRLDIMVTENSKITAVVDELKQKEKLLQQALKDRQSDYQKEQQFNKELYEKEIKSLTLKQKQQIDELNFNAQQSIRKAQLDIEEQLMGEFDNLKFELEVKQNELVNFHVLHKQTDEAKAMEFNRELLLKDQALENLSNINQSLSEQMEQLQKLVERIQTDNEKAIQTKENEIVKLSKQMHIKDQQTKNLLQRLDDICKSLKELEEQRDLLSEEITEKQDKAKQLEQRLDIMIKENENLTNQLSIGQHQMEIVQIKSQNEHDKLKAQFEEDKIQLTLDQKVQFEQCLIQYQETIKYETDRSTQLQQDYKRSSEKQKHYELLSQQLTKELSKCNGRMEELIDVCEQSGQRLEQLEDQIRERDYLLDQEKEKYEKIQGNYEIELQTLQSQINDISQQNSEILQLFNKAQEQSKQLERQNRKTMEDLTIVTKHKLELDTKNKKMQNQLTELQQQSIQNSDLINRYKNQIHQHQQEVEELTRSFQQNFGEKELELQNKYDTIISDLRSQVNVLTNKYNDIARKERDNRFRLKLLKSTQKLPDELNEDNCYQTMKSRIDDQSEYLQRLLVENEDLKKQLYATQSHQSKPSSKKQSILVNAKPEYNEDTERTIKHVQTLGSSTKKVPIKIVQQFNSPSEKKISTNRFLDREVYLQNNLETRKMLRQQSLQRI